MIPPAYHKAIKEDDQDKYFIYIFVLFVYIVDGKKDKESYN